MKKILSISLILIFIFSLSGICFAASTDSDITTINGQNASEYVYPETIPVGGSSTSGSGIVSEDTPDSPPNISVVDEEIPESLPKTGGIPEEAFYAAGAILIITALAISIKRSKAASK